MAERPNIILVHCHDLGQFLGCYGTATVRTPHLDQLAAEGVRFTHSFCTAPSCSPSRASLMTGRYPHTNGVMGLCHAEFAWDLHPGERHLATVLRDGGYATAAVGVIHETHSGWQRCGYEQYQPPARARQATDAALELLDDLAGGERPFYLYAGFIEPHRLPMPDGLPGDHGFPGEHLEPDDSLGISVPPYLADTPGTRAELAGLQGAVRHVDEQVGRLLTALRERGLEENTLVIFTTDHGIAMPRAKCSLYEPGLQIALLLRLPSREGWRRGVERHELISNLDMLPTLCELTGLPAPAGMQGRSFAPLLDGRAYSARDALFCEMSYHDYYDPRRSVRTARHKLIANFTTAPAFMDPSQRWRPLTDTVVPANHAVAYHRPLELYDLEADPWEQHDRIDDPTVADIRADLIARLRSHLASTADPILHGAITPPHHHRALQLLESGT